MSASNVLQDLQIHMESKDGGGAEGRGGGSGQRTAVDDGTE